jgi:predicted ArsR family transcriptional regulator
MEILELLRKRPLSAEAIAGTLGITPNAVRQHLTNLERAELVRSEPQKAGRGRPALLFSLTDHADAVFPKRYGQLASMVLTEIRDMCGDQMLDEIFKRLALRHAQEIEPQLEGLDFERKLEKVVAWIGRAGTLAESEQSDDGIRVTIHNCPFRTTALKFPQVCSITPHLLTQLLDVPVSQEKSIHRRDPYCSFVVQRPATPASD